VIKLKKYIDKRQRMDFSRDSSSSNDEELSIIIIL
jgi:hypothetical protein